MELTDFLASKIKSKQVMDLTNSKKIIHRNGDLRMKLNNVWINGDIILWILCFRSKDYIKCLFKFTIP